MGRFSETRESEFIFLFDINGEIFFKLKVMFKDALRILIDSSYLFLNTKIVGIRQ